MKEYFKLDSLAEELLNAKKKELLNKKPDNRGGSFQKASREINYIVGGPDAYEGKRKQKLTHREVMMAMPSTPEYLRWSEVRSLLIGGIIPTSYLGLAGILCWFRRPSGRSGSIGCWWTVGVP